MLRILPLLFLLLGTTAVQAQTFDAFVADVNAAVGADKQTKVDAFLASVTSFPFMDNDTTAVFIYHDTASSISVTGDFTGWSALGRPLRRLSGTLFWYYVRNFEADARLDYKFIRNGSSWILDPLNSKLAPGGFGPNSELAMPQYVQPAEIEVNPSTPTGSLAATPFYSAIMANNRTVTVYTPPGYDSDRTDPYPVIVYHDGPDYLNIADVPTILNNLIASGRIEPIVAVFVNPVDREVEYATVRVNPFTRFINEELMPWVDSNFHTSTDRAKRAITGPSYGGIASTRHCFRLPEQFGLCGPYSPSYWVSDRALLNEMAQSDLTNIKWYVEWGTYEPSIAETGRVFRDILTSQNADFIANEWHEGHAWGMWRAHQDDMLEFFFPGVNATSTSSLELPVDGPSLDVFPNPHGGQTTVAFQLEEPGMTTIDVVDLLGRHVATLVDTTLPAGAHTASLNRSDLAAGTYVIRIATPSGVGSESMMVLR